MGTRRRSFLLVRVGASQSGLLPTTIFRTPSMASSLTRVARSSVLLASRASPVRTLGARTIVVGRDGRHWNSVLLMVPQAEEWQIERFGKYSRSAQPGLSEPRSGLN